MQTDAKEYSMTCDKCQRYADIHHRPPEELVPIAVPWPFMQWGMDIIGPLPNGKAGKKFVLMATDYFSKWIEAESYVNVKDVDVEKFIWKNIICRFGIPRVIVADNGSQFISSKVRELCESKSIEMRFSTPRHPQANGQAEAANKLILNSLKKRLESAKGNWPEVLPSVLWANRTTVRGGTGETPFSLVYGSEAVIPAELAIRTYRTSNPNPDGSNSSLRHELDFLEEKRLQASNRLAHYRDRAAKFYNARVLQRRFNVGDLVLRRVFQNTQEQNAGKLGPNWEGPYQIIEIARTGTYKLRSMNGTEVPRNWNATNLRRYYH